MKIEEICAQFEAAGHHVSVRGDVDEHAAAWFLECAVKTLRNWRCPSLRRGPPYVPLPCGVRYSIAGLFAWLEAKVIRAA